MISSSGNTALEPLPLSDMGRADGPVRDRSGATGPRPAVGAAHRRLRRDPWRVHGGGAAVHGRGAWLAAWLRERKRD
jgi:hypothetical protein